MSSVALVLGAGGAVGAAYHAGVIAALHDAIGWDARDADLIVGTSAGSGIAASLRAGLAPADHLARATDGELSPEGAALLDPLATDLDLGGRGAWLPLPASPRLAAASVLRRGRPRPGLALAGLLPRGTVDSGLIGDTVRALHRDPWPVAPTWLCAVDLTSGRRVVFGRDDIDADIGEAVQASSAVPSLFRPVKVGGAHYVDGAVHSPTSADLVAGLGYDLAVVVSPMTGVPSALNRSVRAPARAYHARLLRDEVAAVRDRGTRVVTIQPTAADLAVAGINAMDRGRRVEVATQAHRSTLEKLARADVRDALRPVTELHAGGRRP
jgi:NTE family protein